MSHYKDVIATPDSVKRQYGQKRHLPIEKDSQRVTSHPALSPLTNAFIAGSAAVPARLSVHFLSILRINAQAGAIGHRMGPVWGSYYLFSIEGWRVALKGLVASGAKSFPQMVIQFSIYDTLSKRYVPKVVNNKPSISASSAIFFCGAVAGSVAQAVLHPLDVIKTRMIQQNLSKPPLAYSNSLDCVQKILAKDGIVGFYRGIMPSVIGAGVYGAYMFALWDFYNRMPWNRNSNPLFGIEPYLNPIFAVCIASCFSMPFDVVRRKLMAYDPALPKNGRVEVVADTVLNTIKNVHAESGIPGFFRGYVATAFKSVPQLLVFYLFFNGLQKTALAVGGGK